MTRTRFQATLSFVQVTPPADIDHKGTYTLTISKTGLTMQDIYKKKELYQPRRKFAAEEQIVASKHNFSGLFQFMKDILYCFDIRI